MTPRLTEQQLYNTLVRVNHNEVFDIDFYSLGFIAALLGYSTDVSVTHPKSIRNFPAYPIGDMQMQRVVLWGAEDCLAGPILN